MKVSDFLTNIKHIDGIYSPPEDEKVNLGLLFAQSPGRYGIEIGAYIGATSTFLAHIAREVDKKLVVIDPWIDFWISDQKMLGQIVYEKFLRNIEPVKDRVIVIRKFSQEALNFISREIKTNTGFIFIDGDHTEAAAFEDLHNYFPLLLSKGVCCLHDVNHVDIMGPRVALNKYAEKNHLKIKRMTTAENNPVFVDKGYANISYLTKPSNKLFM